MPTQLPKNYDPRQEEAIYKEWLERGAFKAAPRSGKPPFTIVIPPPNVTGVLHMGHALNNTVQDILIRAKRMQGYETLWQPGTDHAAIATEVRVVKQLAEEGLTKAELGRDGFLKRVWQWCDQYGGTIIHQLKRLGCSCDWDRLRFTMDDGLSDAVLEVFTRLYGEGLIYRGERLVNWCVKCRTALSDAEVEHEDREGRLYYFRYPVAGTDAFIPFATTRPETMLGDTAVAVAPGDARYAHLVGKTAVVPSTGREIPIIADEYVDPAYGTGAVKITPAHDPNDFEVGGRHNLPCINILNDDGTINANGGGYAGCTRETARARIILEMQSLGLYDKEEKLTHAVGAHERCGEAVEPLLKLQWFVRMEELARPALQAYQSGELRFNRERFGKIYQHWLENIKDWCISRQIWWGHRIPAYYCPEGHVTVAKTHPAVCAVCGSAELTQDADTLDTWFSSALWPFSTLGWPEKTAELEYFYPTNVLVTAYDIIFFWVVRMVFSGLKFTGRLPFTDVFFTGMVLDPQGQKMSKSKGNGIDPLEVVEQYGADALRLMLVTGADIANDMRFHWERMDASRNFLNKLWNASRFALMNMGDAGRQTADPADCSQAPSGEAPEQSEGFPEMPPAALRAEDKWILSLLDRLIADVTEKLDAFELGLAAQKVVDFIWDEFCDWYVEMVKPRLYDKSAEGAGNRAAAQWTLRAVLKDAVKLLHPFTPFVTETLYRALTDGSETVMHCPWPAERDADDADAERAIESLKEAVRAVRAVRLEKQVPPATKISITVLPSDETARRWFDGSRAMLTFLAGAAAVTVLPPEAFAPENCAVAVTSCAVLYLPLADLIDTAKERERLTREQKKLQQELTRIDGKLGNAGFAAKAPAELIAAEREKRERFSGMLAQTEEQLNALT